jgi:hypothetical protein
MEIGLSPEIINGFFALGGALIGVIGAWLIATSGKEKQKVTILMSPCLKLLDVGDLAKSEVQITYRDTVITDLSAGELTVQNTGTKALEDIEISIFQSSVTPLLYFEVSSSNFSAPDDFISLEADEEATIFARIQYLNPKDRVVFDYRIAGTEKPKVSVRKLGLDVEVRHESIYDISDIYLKMRFGLIDKMPIPGFSWFFSCIDEPYRLYLEAKRK